MRIKFLPINNTPKSEDVLVLLKKGRIERAKYNPKDYNFYSLYAYCIYDPDSIIGWAPADVNVWAEPSDCYMDTDQALMEYMINRLVDRISEVITKERPKNGR